MKTEDILFQIEHIKNIALSDYDDRYLYERMISEEVEELNELVKEFDFLPCVSDKIPKPLDWVYSKLNVKKGSTFKSPEISIRVCASWISEYVNKYYR